MEAPTGCPKPLSACLSLQPWDLIPGSAAIPEHVGSTDSGDRTVTIPTAERGGGGSVRPGLGLGLAEGCISLP